MQADNLPIYQSNIALNEKNRKEAELRASQGDKTPKKEGLLGLNQEQPDANQPQAKQSLGDTARQLDDATKEKAPAKTLTADQMLKESQDLNKEVQKKTGDSSGKDGNPEDSWVRQGISWFQNTVGDTTEYDQLEAERKKLQENSKQFAADGVITKEEQEAYDANKKSLQEKYDIYSKDRAKTTDQIAVVASTTTQIAGTFIPAGGVFVGAVAGAVVDTAIRNGEENKGLSLEDTTTIVAKSAVNYVGGKVAGKLGETQVAKNLINKGTQLAATTGSKVLESTGSNALSKGAEYAVKEGSNVLVKSAADTAGNSIGKVTSNAIDAYRNDKEYGVVDALTDVKNVAIGSVVANVTLKGAIPATKYLEKQGAKLTTYTTESVRSVAGDKVAKHTEKVVGFVTQQGSNIVAHGVRNTAIGYTKTGELDFSQGFTNASLYKVGDAASTKRGITDRSDKDAATMAFTNFSKPAFVSPTVSSTAPPLTGSPVVASQTTNENLPLNKPTAREMIVDNHELGNTNGFNFA